jgi:hypothetical protein
MPREKKREKTRGAWGFQTSASPPQFENIVLLMLLARAPIRGIRAAYTRNPNIHNNNPKFSHQKYIVEEKCFISITTK